MEIKGLDWSKSLENQFWNYFYGMVKYKLKHLFTNKSEGVMTIIAKKIKNATPIISNKLEKVDEVSKKARSKR